MGGMERFQVLGGSMFWQDVSPAVLQSCSAPKAGLKCSIIIYIGLNNIQLASTKMLTNSFLMSLL